MGQFARQEIEGRTPDAIFRQEDLSCIKQQHESGHRYGHHRSEFYLPRKDGPVGCLASRRYRAGGSLNSRLKARLNAASDS